MSDKREEWFSTQMAKERIAQQSNRPPSTVTGSLVVAKKTSFDGGYTMRIHSKVSATTVEKSFATEMAAYDEGMTRLVDVMEREAVLYGRSEYAVYRQGRLSFTEVVDGVDITPVEPDVETNPSEAPLETAPTEVEGVPVEIETVPAETNISSEEGEQLEFEENAEQLRLAFDEGESMTENTGETIMMEIPFIESPDDGRGRDQVATPGTFTSVPTVGDQEVAPAEEPALDEVDVIAGHETVGEVTFAEEETYPVKLTEHAITNNSMVVNFEAEEKAVLWRRVGDKSGTKKLKPGNNEMTYKISPGDSYEFRLGADDGPILGMGVYEIPW